MKRTASVAKMSRANPGYTAIDAVRRLTTSYAGCVARASAEQPLEQLLPVKLQLSAHIAQDRRQRPDAQRIVRGHGDVVLRVRVVAQSR